MSAPATISRWLAKLILWGKSEYFNTRWFHGKNSVHEHKLFKSDLAPDNQFLFEFVVAKEL